MKGFHYLVRWVTLGLAVAFMIVLVGPGFLQPDRPVVTITQTGRAPVAPLAPGQPLVPTGPASYARAVEHAIPAVVNIYTAKVVTERINSLFDDPVIRRFFGSRVQSRTRQRVETSLGSGVLISSQGYLLTNHHVVQGADKIQILLADGRSTPATLIGSDADTDLAVLWIELDGLPAITLGNSDILQVGDVALAIGNPFGIGQTVTMGIISATGRNQLGINTFENFIQTDAAINPGNSGGALINAYGELIGINTAIFSKSGGSQGIGFAIPSDLAVDVMTQIIEHGHAIRGWLGIEVQQLTAELAEALNIGSASGVVVAGVLRRGPAASAGLQPGDLLSSINDRPINDRSDLLNIIANTKPGDSVELRGLRGGNELIVSAQVGQRPTGQ